MRDILRKFLVQFDRWRLYVTGPISTIRGKQVFEHYVQKIIFSSFGYSKLVISMPQYGGMSLARMRDELRKRHAKVSGRKRDLIERYVNGR